MTKKYYALIVGIFIIMLPIPFLSSSVLNKETLKEQRKTNVILISLEATRADHLPCYGYRRNTTPNICELAEDGVLFENAYAQGTQTSCSMPVVLSGLLPSSVSLGGWKTHSMNTSVKTLPEVLKKNGYTTFSTRVNKSNIWQGIDHAYKGKIPDNKTFFLNYKTTDPHFPYIPSDKFRKWDKLPENLSFLENIGFSVKNELWFLLDEKNMTLKELETLYDEELMETDWKVKKLIDKLKNREMYKESLIIIHADHGEVFGEFKKNPEFVGHGGLPLEERIHVPLIIKFPGNRWSGKRIEQPVRLIDITPTVYSYLDLKNVPETYGKSLMPSIKGRKMNLTVFSAGGGPHKDWCLKRNNYKYILKNTQSHCKSGDKAEDFIIKMGKNRKILKKNESTKIINENRKTLCKIYLEGPEKKYKPGKEHLSSKMKERLKNLGYLD